MLAYAGDKWNGPPAEAPLQDGQDIVHTGGNKTHNFENERLARCISIPRSRAAWLATILACVDVTISRKADFDVLFEVSGGLRFQ